MLTGISDVDVASLRAKLEGYIRANDPQEWARLQVCLGDALLQSAQGRHEWKLLQPRVSNPSQQLDQSSLGDTRQQAWNAYWAALEECAPNKDIDLWARACAGLGDTWIRIGLAPFGTFNALWKASQVLRTFLSQYPCERAPLLWGVSQHRLACARFAMARRRDELEAARKLLLEALEALDAASEAFSNHGFRNHHQQLLEQIVSMRQHLARLDQLIQQRAVL